MLSSFGMQVLCSSLYSLFTETTLLNLLSHSPQVFWMSSLISSHLRSELTNVHSQCQEPYLSTRRCQFLMPAFSVRTSFSVPLLTLQA
jgi:hypothetical protein